jgi:hypothetical protein
MYSLANLFLLLTNTNLINLHLIDINKNKTYFDLYSKNYDIILKPEYIKLTDKTNKIIHIIRYNNISNKLTLINNILFFDKNKYSYNYNDIFHIINL